MSTALAEIHEPAVLQSDALRISESVTLEEGALQPDGTVLLHVIRPCVGRGRGRRIYEANMLEKHGTMFAGWKMYIDHLSDAGKRAAGGLPRSIRDLGGRVIESWWDPNVPADPERGYGQGAIVARAKPTPLVRELVENDPAILEASLNAYATGVKPKKLPDGTSGALVEGIAREPRGSIDWVTEGGAGGRVASIMEAVYSSSQQQEETLLGEMTDDEMREYLTKDRPGILTEAAETSGEDDEAGGSEDDITNALPDGEGAGGLQESVIAEAIAATAETGEGGEDVEITAEALQEALESDEGRETLQSVIMEVAPGLVQSLVEAAVNDERALVQAVAQGTADRQIEVRDMRDDAHRKIDEAKLPEKFAAQARAQFEIVEGRPSAALDQIDDVDEEGYVTKSAADKLSEAVEGEIQTQRDLVSSINPTRVEGQGAGAGAEGAEGENEAAPVGPLTESLFEDAGFEDAEKVYVQ